MTKKESSLVIGILLLITMITVFDLFTDLKEGVVWWHVAIEGSVATGALVGVYVLLKGRYALKHSLKKERELSEHLRSESLHWKENSTKFIEGLSKSIDTQLDKWQLTKAEREVAFFLIKGFSLKEIAEYRATTEKTTRAHAASIYSKSGLSGRSQLSAFFLEDLLP